MKTRAWQAILVLLDVLEDNPPQAGHFVEDILDQLKNDSHQMTVRIFMEWCAAKLIMKNQLDLFAIISSAIDKVCSLSLILVLFICEREIIITRMTKNIPFPGFHRADRFNLFLSEHLDACLLCHKPNRTPM